MTQEPCYFINYTTREVCVFDITQPIMKTLYDALDKHKWLTVHKIHIEKSLAAYGDYTFLN